MEDTAERMGETLEAELGSRRYKRGEPARDPFQALKHGEAVAETLARKLAPRRIPKAGEVRRSFCFPGHRLLLRELNWLREARVFVGNVLQRSAEIWHCPHRAVRWTVTVSPLSWRIQRSGYPCPPDLPNDISHRGTTGEIDELAYTCKDSVRGKAGGY